MDYFAGLVTEIKGSTIPIAAGVLNYTVREPLGVIARIGAFNHPLLFFAGKCGAPLAAGNTLIIKPADQTPLSSLRIAELWQDVFPPGVFNVVTGGRDAGAALVAHPRVAKIGFIGSVNGGRAVMTAAGASVKALTLELGGKNALIACADATPDEVADGVVRGMNFRYVTGQSCNSTSRVYLHDAIYDATLPEIVAGVAKIKVGLPIDPETEMGCLSSQPQFDKTMSYIKLGSGRRRTAALWRQAPGEPQSWHSVISSNPPCSPTCATTCVSRAKRSSDPVVSILRWSDENDLRAARQCARLRTHRVDLDARPRPRPPPRLPRGSGLHLDQQREPALGRRSVRRLQAVRAWDARNRSTSCWPARKSRTSA